MKKEQGQLTEADRTFLEKLTKKGELKARAYRRAVDLWNWIYNPAFPVVCFDGRPCFLIGDELVASLEDPLFSAGHFISEDKAGNMPVCVSAEMDYIPANGRRILRQKHILNGGRKDHVQSCIARV